MPSLIRVSPALGEELPISHTRTIDFSVELNSLDLRSKSFTGILIDAVMWPALYDSESLKSTTKAESLLERFINVWQDIFWPPFLAVSYTHLTLPTNREV